MGTPRGVLSAFALAAFGCHGALVQDDRSDASDAGADSAEAPPDTGCGASIPPEFACNKRAGGPAMVQIADFCIDVTEVTNAQYQVFVKAIEAGYVPVKPTKCVSKKSFVPSEVMEAGNRPVTGVDWCDAYAFCAWAGKRLCGRRGDGAAMPTGDVKGGFLDSSQSEWVHACTNGGTSVYPYTGSFAPTRCNGFAAGAQPVRNSCDCHGATGAFAQVFDMSGNVYEWVNSCGTDYCHIAGGSFNSDGPGLRCRWADYGTLDERKPAMGIRCCASAP